MEAPRSLNDWWKSNVCTDCAYIARVREGRASGPHLQLLFKDVQNVAQKGPSQPDRTSRSRSPKAHDDHSDALAGQGVPPLGGHELAGDQIQHMADQGRQDN